ncbi:MAG: hypothetical protein M1833_005262 [Piccolia ochrophora]|nr:MAG: hypothetical protein M1833_005262 [Piccolia ochrophora]
MARSPISIAVGASLAVLFVLYQLLSTYGFPRLDYFEWHEASRLEGLGEAQTSLGPQQELLNEFKDGSKDRRYTLGVGKADITGPSVELNLMGYADPNQVGSGIRQRLFSRAFIVEQANPHGCFMYLVLDTQSGDTAIRHGILEELALMGPAYRRYGSHNVAITGTHSHSGPAAWLNYLLPQITSKGFSAQSYRAIVNGAILSIKRAHGNLEPGYLTYGSINISKANINRSPYAYLANPEAERNRYDDNVDKTLSLLRFQSALDEKTMGVLTWFPVHGTSMHGNNTLISGDNKGVASYLFERNMRDDARVKKDFVAGFSQANVGDTSPNVLGPFCEDGSGLPCDFKDSTCGGKNDPCHGRGPMYREELVGERSCYEIGKRQFEGARALYDTLDDMGTEITQGPVGAFHFFKDFSNFTFFLPNGTLASTCPAALGYSFAAGTTDGPGAFDFKQNNPGEPNANPVWGVVGGFLHEPSAAQNRCHAAKPILLDVGEVHRPYDWTPNLVDIQLLRVGQLIIVVSPGEATTMSGRRWKEAVKRRADEEDSAGSDSIVVLGGPANSYTHYIATEEEYAVQRYEGASTLYGPHTLNAYINVTLDNLHLLDPRERKPDPGPQPPINVENSLSFISPVAFDRAPFFKSFGDVVSEDYTTRKNKTARFVAANPRNNLRLEDTYAAVERRSSSGDWVRVRDDSDWALWFEWERTSTALGTSEVTLYWEVEGDTEPGLYRFHYYGDAKTPFTGAIVPIEGFGHGFPIIGTGDAEELRS